MARINKRELTKLEIIEVASECFLQNGYTDTSIKQVCNMLGMSPGNVTFYFPTKDHLLAELVELLGVYQWKMMEEEAGEGISSLLAVCLELTAMASVCDENEIARDFYLSSYTSPLCLGMVRKNDVEKAKSVFKEYTYDWSEERFCEAEVLVSGIEYATFMKAGPEVSPEARIEGALDAILKIYGVPREMRRIKIQKVLAMNYREIGKRVFSGFKQFVKTENERAMLELLRA